MSREDSLACFKDHRLPEDPFDKEGIFKEQEDKAIVQGMTVPSWLRNDGYVDSYHVMPVALMSPPLLNRRVNPPTNGATYNIRRQMGSPQALYAKGTRTRLGEAGQRTATMS